MSWPSRIRAQRVLAEEQIAGGGEAALIVLRQGGAFHVAINVVVACVLGIEPALRDGPMDWPARGRKRGGVRRA